MFGQHQDFLGPYETHLWLGNFAVKEKKKQAILLERLQ
jgi:hypothetical protein